MLIPTVTIQNVFLNNALLMHAANYGLVWVYNALEAW